MDGRTDGTHAETQYVELFVDETDAVPDSNDYEGVHLMTETVKRDNDRLNLAALGETDTGPVRITGGYILRIGDVDPGDTVLVTDQDTKRIRLFYPDATKVLSVQVEYIESYLNEFENRLADGRNWRRYADDISFADYLITTEFGKNVDGYRSDFYVSKNRLGKLRAGPVSVLCPTVPCLGDF